ncbi:MAG: hypothetical protein NVS4B2_24060 [Chloroflexota bacterium]
MHRAVAMHCAGATETLNPSRPAACRRALSDLREYHNPRRLSNQDELQFNPVTRCGRGVDIVPMQHVKHDLP